MFWKNAAVVLDIILTEDPWVLKGTYKKEKVLHVP